MAACWDDYDICAMGLGMVSRVSSMSTHVCSSYEEIGEDNYTDEE